MVVGSISSMGFLTFGSHLSVRNCISELLFGVREENKIHILIVHVYKNNKGQIHNRCFTMFCG